MRRDTWPSGEPHPALPPFGRTLAGLWGRQRPSGAGSQGVWWAPSSQPAQRPCVPASILSKTFRRIVLVVLRTMRESQAHRPPRFVPSGRRAQCHPAAGALTRSWPARGCLAGGWPAAMCMGCPGSSQLCSLASQSPETVADGSDEAQHLALHQAPSPGTAASAWTLGQRAGAQLPAGALQQQRLLCCRHSAPPCWHLA